MKTGIEKLTKAEKKQLYYMSLGYTDNAIANKLYKNIATVRAINKSIYVKIVPKDEEKSTRIQAVLLALEEMLKVDIPSIMKEL